MVADSRDACAASRRKAERAREPTRAPPAGRPEPRCPRVAGRDAPNQPISRDFQRSCGTGRGSGAVVGLRAVSQAMAREAVICEPLRTPVGRFGGVFRDVGASVLAATVIGELVNRTGLRGEDVEDVVMGQCYPNGEAPAIGRVAALDAGLPVDVPGIQVDRRCGSALQAVLYGCMQVQSGAAELVLAGGAESMSQVELYSTKLRWGVRSGGAKLEDRLARSRVTAGGVHHPVPGGMLETAENVRRDYGIGREEQDELALRSHQRAVSAQTNGAFAEEIVPVPSG